MRSVCPRALPVILAREGYDKHLPASLTRHSRQGGEKIIKQFLSVNSETIRNLIHTAL